MPEPVLAVSGLHAGYGGAEILHGVDLTVQHGEIAGVPIHGARPRSIVSRGLIHVPEGRRIFPNLTVRENLDLGSYRRARARRADNRRRVFALFSRLEERQSQLAGTLSGGEQQMLAIGRALMAEPKL